MACCNGIVWVIFYALLTSDDNAPGMSKLEAVQNECFNYINMQMFVYTITIGAGAIFCLLSFAHAFCAAFTVLLTAGLAGWSGYVAYTGIDACWNKDMEALYTSDEKKWT